MTVTHDRTSVSAPPETDRVPTSSVAAPAAPAPLTVGAADDVAEARADALADTVLRRLAGAQGTADDEGPHAHSSGCGHLRRSTAPSTAAVGAAGGDLDARTAATIESRRSAGRGLPTTLRRDLESAFGTGLGHVRLHDDTTSRELARGMSANAFTTGDDVFLGDIDTSTPEGKRVLTHEIAHVVQETGSAVRRSLLSRLKAKVFGPEDPAQVQREQDLDAAHAARSSEDRRLAQDRETNTAARAAKSAEIYGPADALVPTPAGSGSPGPSKAQRAVADLNNEMAQALAAEADVAAALADAGTAPAAAAQEAYEATFGRTGTHAHLAPHAPARRTESERLMALIRKARAKATMSTSLDDGAGGLLDRDIEAVYLTAAKKAVDEARAATRAQGASVAAQAAAAAGKAAPGAAAPPAAQVDVPQRAALLVEQDWALAPAKLRARRPAQGSTLDLEMRRRAIVRAERETPEGAKAPLVTFDGASDSFDSVTDATETITGLSAVTDGSESRNDRALAQSPVAAGELVTTIKDVGKRKAGGFRGDKAWEDSQDDPSQQAAATEVFSDTLAIVTSLKSAVVSLKRLVASARTMSKDGVSTGEMLTSVKSGSDALGSLASGATSTAKFAAGVADKVGDNVAKVVPGLNIVSTIFGVVSAIVDVVTRSREFNTSKEGLTNALLRGKDAEGADVMVRPMLRVAQSSTINLEKASWSAGKAVGDLGVAIATVASAGGFGIPSAVGAGLSVIDALHDVGHLIAHEVLLGLERRSVREETGRLEGAAEKLLQRSPATAVDGIIVRAAGGDAIALAFLASFEVDDAPVDAAMLAGVSTSGGEDPAGDDTLLRVREVVLEQLDESADPAHIFARYARSVADPGKSVLARFRETGTMADKKNAIDRDTAAQGGPAGKERGFGWRVGQMFARTETHERRMERTDHRSAEHRAGLIGPEEVPAGASAATVLAIMERATDGELKAALADPKNPATVREAIMLFLAEKAKAAATTGGNP